MPNDCVPLQRRGQRSRDSPFVQRVRDEHDLRQSRKGEYKTVTQTIIDNVICPSSYYNKGRVCGTYVTKGSRKDVDQTRAE